MIFDELARYDPRRNEELRATGETTLVDFTPLDLPRSGFEHDEELEFEGEQEAEVAKEVTEQKVQQLLTPRDSSEPEPPKPSNQHESNRGEPLRTIEIPTSIL